MGSHKYHIRPEDSLYSKGGLGVGPWEPLVLSHTIAPKTPETALEWPATAQINTSLHTIMVEYHRSHAVYELNQSVSNRKNTCVWKPRGGSSSSPTYRHSLSPTRGFYNLHAPRAGLCMVRNSASQIEYIFTTMRNSESPIKLRATVVT